MDPWIVAIGAYVALAAGTFIPVLRAARRKITKQDVENSVAQAKDSIAKARPIGTLDDATKEAIALNFERIAGTLVFWKFEAAKYKAAHYYSLIWTIPSAVLIPILTQAVTGS